MKNPISRFLYLFNNIKEKENKIALLFYVCLLIIIIVDVCFGYFFYYECKTMLIINSLCLLFNIFLYFLLEKGYRSLTVYLLLSELYIFLICATLMIGWNYGFQQYIFGMLCIFFLPFYTPENNKNRSRRLYSVGLLFVATYYILAYICLTTDLAPGIKSSLFPSFIIYGVNSLISMTAVGSFCFLSSLINNEVKRKLKRKADFDSLTQIYNRYSLNQIIDDMNTNNKDFYFSIADIDFFKLINDTYGHNAGDEVLKIVSLKLKELTKYDIKVGRWGGEEFLILSAGDMSHLEFKNHLEEVRSYFENKVINIEKYKIKITISFGIGKNKKGLTSDEIVKNADNNLYKAKNSGRNKIVG